MCWTARAHHNSLHFKLKLTNCISIPKEFLRFRGTRLKTLKRDLLLVLIFLVSRLKAIFDFCHSCLTPSSSRHQCFFGCSICGSTCHVSERQSIRKWCPGCCIEIKRLAVAPIQAFYWLLISISASKNIDSKLSTEFIGGKIFKCMRDSIEMIQEIVKRHRCIRQSRSPIQWVCRIEAVSMCSKF